MKLFLLVFGFLLGCSAPLAAQTGGSPTAALEQAISEAIHRRQPVADSGVAVAVVRDRKLLYAGGFGLRDRGSAQKVDPETLFAIGSATKAFTGLAVSMLAEQGKIALDVAINNYVHDFGMRDSEAQAKMTLEDILSHSTGLPRHDALWYLPPFSRSQLLHRLRYLDPNSKPGKGFRKSFEYNSMTYSGAAYVLESVTGDSWETFVKARILDPLGMTKSNLSLAAFQNSANRAKGYFLTDELPLKNFDNIGPAALINSNALEMTQWVLLYLNQGVTADGTKIVDRATLEKTYKGSTAIGPGAAYGLGWVVQSRQGKRFVWHNGIPDGYSTYVSFMPDDGLAVVILTNQHHDIFNERARLFPEQVALDIYAHLLPASHNDSRSARETAHAADAPTPAGDQASPASQPGGPQQPSAGSFALAGVTPPPASDFTGLPRDYTGMYSNPGFGDISITVRGSALQMSYYQSTWPLQKIAPNALSVSPDLFYFSLRTFGVDRLLPVTFNRNAAGEVDKLSLPLDRDVKQVQFIRR